MGCLFALRKRTQNLEPRTPSSAINLRDDNVYTMPHEDQKNNHLVISTQPNENLKTMEREYDNHRVTEVRSRSPTLDQTKWTREERLHYLLNSNQKARKSYSVWIK